MKPNALANHRGFAAPWVLLVLAESPGHGYDLIHRLREVGFDWGSRSGPVYRELQNMTTAGLLASTLITPEAGPSRRVYELTPEGRVELEALSEVMSDLASMVGSYLRRYCALQQRPPPS